MEYGDCCEDHPKTCSEFYPQSAQPTNLPQPQSTGPLISDTIEKSHNIQESQVVEKSVNKKFPFTPFSDEEFLDLKCSAEQFLEKVVNVGDQRYTLSSTHTRQMIEEKPYEGLNHE